MIKQRICYYLWLVAICILLYSSPVFGQTPLAGSYTIGLSGSEDFDSFGAAIDSLESNGVSSAVTFNVVAGTYDEDIAINSIEGASETNTISFIGEGASTTIIEVEAGGSVRLDHTSYVTLKQIGSSGGIYVRFSSMINVEQCIFYQGSNNNAMLVYKSDSVFIDSCQFNNGTNGVVYIAYSDYIILSNSELSGGNEGLKIAGSTDTYVTGNRLINTGNCIFAITTGSNQSLYFENNFVEKGASVGWFDLGQYGEVFHMVNNVIHGEYAALIGGISLADSVNIIHNTFIGDKEGVEIKSSTATKGQMKNNLIVCQYGPALIFEESFGDGLLDYNAYINSDTSTYKLMKSDSESFYDIEAYQSSYSNMDQNSHYADINYIDTDGYHILSATAFHFGAMGLGVDEDIDGNPRGLFGDAVDVGVDEFSGYVGDVSKVSGKVFIDENDNGIQDSNETGLSNVQLDLSPYGITTFTDQNGCYYFYKGDSDTLTITLEELSYFDAPVSDTTLLPSSGDVENINLAYQVNTLFNDFEVDFTTSIRRCFRTINGYLTYTNTGTISQDITLSFTPDESYTLASSMPSWDREDGGTYFWDIEDVSIFESGAVLLGLTMPGTDEIGEMHTSVLSVANSDSTIEEKEFSYDFVCAYDPNDKAVSPAGLGDDNLVLKTDSLEYLIRFQNTGNDTAFDIRIVDQLSEYLDLSTFEFIASSHDVRTELNTATNQLIFYYDNIQLVDSVANEPESHGFVKFRIYPKADIADSTVITNTAYIYFDFNPAIVTNTVSTMMVEEIPEELLPVPTALPIANEVGAVTYPNPNTGFFYLQLPDAQQVQVEVFTLEGALVHRHHYQQANIPFDFRQLEKGMYLIRVEGLDYSFTDKVLIR